MSAGWLRRNSSTRGTTASAASEAVIAAVRHPWLVASQATIGRKMSCPVALPAVRMPLTRPRRATNQRLVMVATKAIDIDPVPSPTTSPQLRMSCQGSVMKTVSPLPAATMSSAKVTTGRTPKRSIRAAANGEIRPKSIRLSDTAEPMSPCDQPNSSWSGSISTPGTERNAAAPTRVTKATAATTQAQCRRVSRSAAGEVVVVTRTSLVLPARRARVAETTTCARIRP